MIARIALMAALALPLASCSAFASAEEYQEAIRTEQRAEDILEEAEALPVTAPGRAELIEDARAEEASAERIRKALERLQRDSLIGDGVRAVGEGARGNYFGVIDIATGLLSALGAYMLSRRKSKAETEAAMAALERRRDESRNAQGIAGAAARSADQRESLVAQAARRIAQDDAAAQVRAELARQRKAEYDARKAAQAIMPRADRGLTASPTPLGAEPIDLDAALAQLHALEDN